MDLFTVKLNKFLDCILDIIYEFGGDRPILFTSFSPELYMALAAKQDTYPILFLNDSCNWPTGDVRTISIQTAVHFSRHLGLDGVVMASEPFVASPKLVKAMQDRGLYCASYGALNDEPDKAKIQADAGLDDHRQSGASDCRDAEKAGRMLDWICTLAVQTEDCNEAEWSSLHPHPCRRDGRSRTTLQRPVCSWCKPSVQGGVIQPPWPLFVI